ncbi:MAG: hypothetical protein PSV13_15760 [Lacunisphaera sp.]|nr:hypothetical protein [Lacunisphaera sp.]
MPSASEKLLIVIEHIRLGGMRHRGMQRRKRYVAGGVKALCSEHRIRRSHLRAWHQLLLERGALIFQDGRLFRRWKQLSDTNAQLENAIRDHRSRLKLLDEELLAHGKTPPRRRRFRPKGAADKCQPHQTGDAVTRAAT